MHTVSVGDSVPWTLTFADTGTGLPRRDRADGHPAGLPGLGRRGADLLDQRREARSRRPGGGLRRRDRTVGLTWPAGGRADVAGRAVHDLLGLVLQAGPRRLGRPGDQPVRRSRRRRRLTACTNASGNGQGTLSGLAATCGTSNYVQPITAPVALHEPRACRATSSGAPSPARSTRPPAATCTRGRQRLLRVAVAPRTPSSAAPTSGASTRSTRDRRLRLPRVRRPAAHHRRPHARHRRRPRLHLPAGLRRHPGVTVQDVPAGTAVSWEVTTEPRRLPGAGPRPPGRATRPARPTRPPWTPSGAFTGDWADVTGLRVTLDFTATASGALAAATGRRCCTAPSTGRLPSPPPTARRSRSRRRRPRPSPGTSSARPPPSSAAGACAEPR